MARSRILRADAGVAAQPPWRSLSTEPSSASPHSVSLAEHELSARCRIAELEHRVLELERAAAAASEEGFRRGLEEGAAVGHSAAERFESMSLQLAETVARLAGMKAELRAAAEKDLLDLSLAIARRVLHRELHVDPHALQGIVSAAIERLRHQDIAKVKTHPQHVLYLRQALDLEMPGNHIEVTADPALEPGSVIFEMPRGNLDVSADSQLEEIERGLADHLRRSS